MAERSRGLSRSGTVFYASGNAGAGLLFAFTNAALSISVTTACRMSRSFPFGNVRRTPACCDRRGRGFDHTRASQATPLFILVIVPVTALSLSCWRPITAVDHGRVPHPHDRGVRGLLAHAALSRSRPERRARTRERRAPSPGWPADRRARARRTL
jgi:hypothetical protein